MRTYIVTDSFGRKDKFKATDIEFGGNGLFVIRDGKKLAHFTTYSSWRVA